MPKCRTCNDTGIVDAGIDTGRCQKCEPNLAAIKDVIAASSDGGMTADDLEHKHQFSLLIARYEELVEVLKPADWQTPLSRARELIDNLVIVAQMKELVSRS